MRVLEHATAMMHFPANAAIRSLAPQLYALAKRADAAMHDVSDISPVTMKVYLSNQRNT